MDRRLVQYKNSSIAAVISYLIIGVQLLRNVFYPITHSESKHPIMLICIRNMYIGTLQYQEQVNLSITYRSSTTESIIHHDFIHSTSYLMMLWTPHIHTFSC